MTDTFLYLNTIADLPHALQHTSTLSPTDCDLLMLVHNLSHRDGFCFAGNPFLANTLGKSEKTIANSLTTLRKLNYIDVIGGGNQWKTRQIYVKTEILKQQEQETQAFFQQKIQELNDYADARKQTEKARSEYIELYHKTLSPDIAPESGVGDASGRHREGTLHNVIYNNITDQHENNNNNDTSTQPPLSSLSDDRSLSSHSNHETLSVPDSVTPDPVHHDELLTLAETCPELNISANDLRHALDTYSLTRPQIRHIFLNTAAAHASNTILKTPKAYFFGCCHKAMQGTYDFEMAQDAGQRQIPDIPRPIPDIIQLNDPEQVWCAAQTSLETTLNRSSFNTWIRRIQLDTITPERAVFTVPDEVFIYQLTQYYIPVLQRTFQQLGTPVNTVEFQCVDPIT